MSLVKWNPFWNRVVYSSDTKPEICWILHKISTSNILLETVWVSFNADAYG